MSSGGRPPKYDWDDKKDICYQLYVEQKKSPPEIVRYFANHFNVPESEIPSARLFRRQFLEKWGFPRRIRRLTKDEEALVVERIKQLWEQNLRVKEIRETLEDEGWHLRDIEFRRLRLQNDFKRREGTSGSGGNRPDASSSSNKRKRDEPRQQVPVDNVYALNAGQGATGGCDAGANALMALHSQHDYRWTLQSHAHLPQPVTQMHQETQPAQPNRKRKKRARSNGHLPADGSAVDSPFNSETTLTECKTCLRIDNDMYMAIRADFEQICVELGIERKKFALENGLWQQAKDRLVRENMHLSALMHPLQPELEKKTIALDNICFDVTKRMRVMNQGRLKLAEANNMLGLNPKTSKEVRQLFQDILAREGYTNRQECGEEHWTAMRNEWHALSPVLTQAVTESMVDPMKMKAIDLLGREAVKRYSDDKAKSEAQDGHAPGPFPAQTKPKGPPRAVPPKRIKPPKPPKEPKPRGRPRKEDNDPQLDPALAALDEPIPVDFRLGPDSHIVGYHPRIWHGDLKQRSVPALHQAARNRAGAANVTSVHGIIKNDDGTEGTHGVVANEDLDVYLNAAGEKPTFVVVLEGGYA